MRSRWKGKFFDIKIYRPGIFFCSSLAVLRGRAARKRNYVFLWLKTSTIPTFLVRKRIAVYNGFSYSSFIVHRYMAGRRRLGEFVRTKLLGAAIHRRKKRKKAPKKKRGK